MDFFLHLLAMIGMTLPNVLGYNLIFGKGRTLHFGPIGVLACTAYTVFITLGLTESYILAVLAGLVATMLISVFFAWLSLRLDADGLGVMSIAVHLSIVAVILNWSSLTRGSLGITNIQRMPFLDSVSDFAFISILVAALWTTILWRINRSSYGRQLSALAEHNWHARSLGIGHAKVQIIAFVLGGLGALITGVLFPQYLTLLHPNDYHFPSLIFIVMVVVAGKPGSVLGVTLSTCLLVLLREGLRFVPLSPSVLGPVRLIIFGLILFIAVWIRRDTLFPQKRSV